MVCNTKLHKNPYKFRFIAGARHSTSKKASVILHRMLVFFKSHFLKYCQAVKKRSGITVAWTMDGSKDVHNMFTTLNGRKIQKVYTADFSTMFTMFEHDIIMENILALINLCFNNAGKDGVYVTERKIWYSNRINNCRASYFDKYQCYKLVKDIVDNTYVTFAGMIFKQIKGVPMGGNASPMLADLSLAMLEFSFLKKNHGIARKMRFTKRYIDDLLCIQMQATESSLSEIASNIYPESLELQLTSDQNVATFLDAKLSIGQNERLQVHVYNKTDDFNFEVVKYVDNSSNISENIGYNVFYGELVRFARITNDYKNFCARAAKLFVDFKNKGFLHIRLLQRLNSFLANYATLLYKFELFTEKDRWLFLKKFVS